MPFTDAISFEQKIRINLSTKALTIIEEDMNVFEIEKTGTFINAVFTNFKDYAVSSIIHHLDTREQELSQMLTSISLTQAVRKKIIDALLRDEKTKIESQIKVYQDGYSSNKLYRLSNENMDYLTLDSECQENLFYSRPSIYVKCVIEEYCRLPFIERERIYKRDEYRIIENACQTGNILKITSQYNGHDIPFWVYPYKIVPDSMGTQAYLVCKSRFFDNPNETMRIACFNMSRLSKEKIKIYEKKFFISKNEKDKIEEELAVKSPAFLTGNSEIITVRLTPLGEKMYKTKLFSRPVKDSARSHDDIYIFNCSQHQAYYYFFNFGPEAEIISPPLLREMFCKKFNEAADSYNQNT